MSDTTEQAELADAFRAETNALVDLDRRIGRLMRERRRLERAFDAVAAAIDASLARGEAPLALIDDLSESERRLERLNSDLAEKIGAAKKLFSARPKLYSFGHHSCQAKSLVRNQKALADL